MSGSPAQQDAPRLPSVPLVSPLGCPPPTPPHNAEVDAAAAQRASEPLPTTSFPLEPPSDEVPPTYDALREAEPNNPRFARWGGWIEKRAQERRAERQAERATGTGQRTSWNLPHGEVQDFRRDLSARWRDNEAEKRLSRESVLQVVNPDVLTAPTPSSSRARRTRTESSASSASTSRSKLTRNVVLHRVSSRFGCGIPERPLCACVLPGGGVASGDERFVLIGTQTGLYLLDNRPTSASIPLSTSSSSAEAQILPLWTGLSIRRLEVYAEPAIGTDSPQGLVLGLVEEDGVPGLRMWTLACIVNLVKWRVYDQNSIALPLGSRASKSSADRHSSSLTYAKSFVGSTSPKCRKGKGLASPLQPPPHTHRDSAKPGYLFVDTNVHFDTGADSPTASLRSLNRLSLADSPSISQPPPLSEAERLATPLDWARSSVPLPLSTGSGDILFFQLSRSPEPAPSTDEGDSSDSSDSYEDEPAASRRYRTAQDERDKLFLFVVTSKSIFLYESRPSGRRSWTLTKEYFAPSAPRFLRLVRTIGQTPLAPTASPSLASTLYSPDLALLVGLAHHSVLIRLCDSSVTELSLPPSSLPHSGAAGSRSRSSSNTSLASLSPTHRRTSSIVPLLQELKDHPVVAKVARFVEGEKGVPAGMRGTDGPIPKGKRAKDDEGGLASIASLSAGKWVGCEEIRVDNGRRPKRRFFLFTKGTTTYLVASPLYLTPPVSPIAAHSAPHLTPLHTFHWPTLGTSPSSSLTHLSAFIAPLENGSSFSHLILVGFSSTGLSIQEHLVSHAGVEAVFASPSATVPQDSTKRIVVPLDSASVPTGNEEDDPDLSNSATLDFGRETGWLCATRDDGCAEHSASDARGGYVWTRAQGEYVVKRVGVKV